MMKLGLLLTALLWPFGAAAAERSADASRLAGCVERSSGTPEMAKEACVGIFAEVFAEECPAVTTTGMAECLMTEQRAWDELLNAWWGPMRARAKAEGDWPALLAAQRQWIRDRDTRCREVQDAGGGTMRMLDGASCLRDLTAERAIEFHHALRPLAQ